MGTSRVPGTPSSTWSRPPASSSTLSTASAETTLAGLSLRRPREVSPVTTPDAATSRPTTAWTSEPPETTTPTTPSSEASISETEDSNSLDSDNKKFILSKKKKKKKKVLALIPLL